MASELLPAGGLLVLLLSLMIVTATPFRHIPARLRAGSERIMGQPPAGAASRHAGAAGAIAGTAGAGRRADRREHPARNSGVHAADEAVEDGEPLGGDVSDDRFDHVLGISPRGPDAAGQSREAVLDAASVAGL